MSAPLALLIVFIAITPISAQEAVEPPPDVSLFGKRYDAFRGMFANRKLQIGTVDEFVNVTRSEAEDWIVVALGDVKSIPGPAIGWKSFARSGGALLVATDHGVAPVAEEFDVRFIGQPVLAGPGVECYPNQPDCPLVFDFTPESTLFEGITVLALNRSGWLQAPEVVPGESTAARLPNGVTFAGQPLDRAKVVYGAAEGQGRILFAADHSLFINETMLNEDDEVLNAAFADNVVKWLSVGREPESLKVLFLEDGKPIEEWVDPRYVTGEWPANSFQDRLMTLDKLLRAMNRLMLEQQARRDPETGLPLYNQRIRDWESRQRPGAFLQAAVWGLAAFLAMTTAAWLLGRRTKRLEHPPAAATHDGKPNPPPPYGPKSEDDPTHRSLLDRRRIEMLEEGYYIDLARRLSKVWLTQQTGQVPVGEPIEPEAVKGGGRRLRDRWRQAWLLAADADQPKMSLKEFQKFRADLAQLQGRLDAARRGQRPTKEFA